eukprot:scaffold4454_cov411-Prasinococcus_capsulatus_cf.AAC.9
MEGPVYRMRETGGGQDAFWQGHPRVPGHLWPHEPPHSRSADMSGTPSSHMAGPAIATRYGLAGSTARGGGSRAAIRNSMIRGILTCTVGQLTEGLHSPRATEGCALPLSELVPAALRFPLRARSNEPRFVVGSGSLVPSGIVRRQACVSSRHSGAPDSALNATLGGHTYR